MMECTFTCGHALDFRASPPRKGELMWCRVCQSWQHVVSTKATSRCAEDSPEEDSPENEKEKTNEDER